MSTYTTKNATYITKNAAFNKLTYVYKKSKRIEDKVIFNSIKSNFKQYLILGTFESNYYLINNSGSSIFKIESIEKRTLTQITKDLKFWYPLFIINDEVYCYNEKYKSVTIFNTTGNTKKNVTEKDVPDIYKTFVKSLIVTRNEVSPAIKTTSSPQPEAIKYCLPLHHTLLKDQSGKLCSQIPIDINSILKVINKENFNTIIQDLVALTNVVKGRSKISAYNGKLIIGKFPSWVTQQEKKQLIQHYDSMKLPKELQIPSANTVLIKVNDKWIPSYDTEKDFSHMIYMHYSNNIFNLKKSKEMLTTLNDWDSNFWSKLLVVANKFEISELNVDTINSILMIIQEYKRSLKPLQKIDLDAKRMIEWFYTMINDIVKDISTYFNSQKCDVFNVGPYDGQYYLDMVNLLDFPILKSINNKEYSKIKIHIPNYDSMTEKDKLKYCIELILSNKDNHNTVALTDITRVLYDLYEMPNPFYNLVLFNEKKTYSQAEILRVLIDPLSYYYGDDTQKSVRRQLTLLNEIVEICSTIKVDQISCLTSNVEISEMDDVATILIASIDHQARIKQAIAYFCLAVIFTLNSVKMNYTRELMQQIENILIFALENINKDSLEKIIPDKELSTQQIWYECFRQPERLTGINNYIPKIAVKFNIGNLTIDEFINTKTVGAFRFGVRKEQLEEFKKFITN